MANKAFTPAELASNIAFQTAKKASPKVSTTPAPLQSLLKPQSQQPQATFSNNIPWVGLSQVNNPIKTVVETPKTPAVLPTTGAETNKTLSKDRVAEIIKNAPAGADKKAIVNKLIERGYTLEWYGAEKPSTAQNLAWWVVQSSIWLPQLWAKLINPVFNALDKYVIDPISKKLWADPDKVAQNTAQAQQARQWLMKWAETFWQQVTWWDPESTAFKWAKLVWDIAQTAILPWPWWLKAGAWFIKGVGQLAKQWAIETAKFTAISEKRLPTPKELAYWVGWNVALWWAIKGLQLTGKYLPKALKESANKSVSQALAPTWKKMKQITEKLTPQFLKKWIRGSQESIQKLAQEWVEEFGSKIDDAIEWWALDDVFVPRQVVDDVLTLAKGKTMVDWKVVNTVEHRVISEMQDMISQFPDKVWWKQARAIKQILDKVVYATKWGIWAEDLSYKNTLAKSVADSLRNELSKASPDLAKLNKEFSFYKNLQDVIDTTITRQKPQQWAFRKFAGAIVWGNTQWWPIDKVLWYIGTKLFLDATSSATRNTVSAQLKNKLANGIAKLSWAEINSAIQAIKKENPTLALPYYKEWLVFSTSKWQIGSARPTVKTPITIREIQWLAKNPWTTKGALWVPKKEVVPVVPKVDTFKKMTELDTNPQYKKLTQQETNYKKNVKGLETEYGTVENVKYDNRYNVQELTIDWVKYPADEVNNFWKKVWSEEIKSNALLNKNWEIRNKLKAIRNWKENKVSWPQLRIVMEDLWLKSINDIPDESLQTVLDLSRKQVPWK